MVVKFSIAKNENLFLRILQFPIILIIALSLSALIYAVASYNHIHLNSFSLLTLILSTLIPVSYFTFKYLDTGIKPLDALAALIFLFPFVILFVLSPLPLVDDIRYIASTYFVPSGIFTLVGWIVRLVQEAFFTGKFISYWAVVFMLFYSYYIVFLKVLERLVGLKRGMLYLATFAAIYGLNLLIPIHLEKFLSAPLSYHNYIFHETNIYALGRRLYFDPNLLKNFAILLPFLILLSKNKKVDVGLIPLTYILSILYHPILGLSSILVVIFLRLRSVSYTLIDYVGMSGLTLISIMLLSFLTSYNYFTLFALKSNISFLFNGAIWILPIVVGVILSKLAYYIQRNNNYQQLYILSTFMIFILFIVRSPVLLAGKGVYLDLFNVVIFCYYLIIPSLLFLLLVFDEHRAHEKVKNSFTYLLPYVVILLAVIILSEFFNYLYNINYLSYLNFISYENKLVRSIFLAPSVFLFIILFFNLLSTVNKKKFKKYVGALIIIFIIANQLFFIIYWGYYYRCPWAVPGMTVEDSNNALSEVEKMSYFQKKDLIGSNGKFSWDVRDIISYVHTGQPFLGTPMNGDLKAPYLSYNFLPKYFVINENHPTFNLFSSNIYIKHLPSAISINGNKIHIFKINNATLERAKYIVGPSFLPRPDFAPQYFKDITIIQEKNKDSYLYFINNDIKSDQIIAEIKLKSVEQLSDKRPIDMCKLEKEGYEFLVLDTHEEKLEINLRNGNYKILELFESPKNSFIVSLDIFNDYTKKCEISFENVEKIVIAKGYEINYK